MKSQIILSGNSRESNLFVVYTKWILQMHIASQAIDDPLTRESETDFFEMATKNLQEVKSVSDIRRFLAEYEHNAENGEAGYWLKSDRKVPSIWRDIMKDATITFLTTVNDKRMEVAFESIETESHFALWINEYFCK